ncbi:MAG: iron chelate uptake ABC transporter family permease subunit [Cyclobacteriaceae bacterium]
METLIEFFTFQYPNIKYVLFGSILLSVSSAIVGCFTFLKKKALVGDVVSHAVLPGICLAFLFSTNILGLSEKNPVILLIGAFLTGWLSIIVIDNIVQKTKLKEDTATGLALSVFFGIGILLMTYIQKQGGSAQTGLDSFLFGKAASLVGDDLITFAVISILLIIAVVLLFKEFTLISFDPAFAQAIGYPVKSLNLALTTLTVLAVVTGIQAVGVVLMAAMLITPAAAARFWTDNLKKMILLAAIFGAFSGTAGAYISFVAPAMPTGPWIVMILSLIALGSFFLSPRKGILFKILKRQRIRKLILEENILKLFFQLGEKEKNFKQPRSIEEIIDKRAFSTAKLKIGLHTLKRQGYLTNFDKNWKLTREGFNKGKRVLKLHRLWEVYLTQYLRIAPDHVHEDAERIEHIITPELEKRLEQLLEYPDKDPHESEIPY